MNESINQSINTGQCTTASHLVDAERPARDEVCAALARRALDDADSVAEAQRVTRHVPAREKTARESVVKAC